MVTPETVDTDRPAALILVVGLGFVGRNIIEVAQSGAEYPPHRFANTAVDDLSRAAAGYEALAERLAATCACYGAHGAGQAGRIGYTGTKAEDEGAMMNRIIRKAATVARNTAINKNTQLINWLQLIMPTGPRIDRFLDYLYAWNRLQYRPRIRSPRTFNETILASKYDFQGDVALARRIVDKVQFKAWLSKMPAWRPLVVPTLAVFDTPQALRGRVFDADTILKPTHMSGKVLIIDHRRRLTDQEVYQFEQRHERDWYKLSREPVYKGVTPRIILEPFLRDQDGLPASDFKFFMIGGRPLMIQLDRGRHTNHTRQLYSPDWELFEFAWFYPRPADPFPRPAQLDAALEAASDLARPFPLCRVDLYLLHDGAIKAGEVTFFPGGGHKPFLPVEADFELGRKAKALISGALISGTGQRRGT